MVQINRLCPNSSTFFQFFQATNQSLFFPPIKSNESWEVWNLYQKDIWEALPFLHFIVCNHTPSPLHCSHTGLVSDPQGNQSTPAFQLPIWQASRILSSHFQCPQPGHYHAPVLIWLLLLIFQFLDLNALLEHTI